MGSDGSRLHGGSRQRLVLGMLLMDLMQTVLLLLQ
jgi:ABC-type transport system involved in cytochrome bd biosynthesis fused ATPase/permease subunit